MHADKAEAAVEAGRMVMDLVRDERAAEPDPHPRGVRERDRRGRRQRRLDERRAAPDGDRARGGIPLELEDFDSIASRTPIVADLKPGGRYVATDLTGPAASGSSLASSSAPGCVHARRARGRRADARRGRRRGQRDAGPGRRRLVRRPLKPTGGLAILRGSLAPEGSVVKLSGHERLYHRGPARVFDSEEDVLRGRQGAARSSRATWS